MKLSMFLLLLTLTVIATTAQGQSKVIHNYYWRDYKGLVPKDAINGTANLYIAQVYYEGILPATFYESRKEAVTECLGQKRIVKTPIKILCDKRKDNFEWEHVNINSLTVDKLEDKVTGGFEVGYTLYIGRVFHEGEWKIGKVFPMPYQHKGLTVWYNNGMPYRTQDFEILKYLGKQDDEVLDCNQIVYPFDVRSA